MHQHNALLAFSRTPQIARSNTDEPFSALPWEDLDALYTAFLGDVIESACRLANVDVLLYRNPSDLSDDFFHSFRERIRYYDMPDFPLSEVVRHAIENAFAQQYHRVVVLVENHPILRTRFFARVFQQLEYEDDCIVVGPTVEGKCFLVGLKTNHSVLFDRADQDPISKPHIFMERLCSVNAMLFLTQPSYQLDSGPNLARLKEELDSACATDSEFPHRTYDMFKMFEKKYKLKKST